MKIAFFGLKRAFDFFQIGGTESFVRRLSLESAKKDAEVDYILYGDGKNKDTECSGINLNYCASFDKALRH
jgi:hypothetical protein